MVRLLLAGGGTGGHVFPLVAVAQALRAEEPDVEVVFAGTERGMEKRILGELGEKLELLDILPIKGGGLRGAVRGAARAALSLPSAYELVRRLSPAAVLSIGGYAAGPVCVAARAGKVPVALLEPNCVVGLANRLCSPVAARAYLAFPEVRRRFRRGAALVTGVPLRTGFEPRDYAAGGDALRVLVIGGSLGAITLNHNVPEAIGLLVRESAVPIEVTHQSGHDRQHEVRERYERAGVADRVTLVPFIADVPGALARADVVIERAGASAVSEVCAVGRASVLIPYPFAAGDHQMHNARAMEAAGAAVCMPSEEASPPRIAGVLRLLARDPERRARMAAAARARGRPHAARVIARDLLRLAGGA